MTINKTNGNIKVGVYIKAHVFFFFIFSNWSSVMQVFFLLLLFFLGGGGGVENLLTWSCIVFSYMLSLSLSNELKMLKLSHVFTSCHQVATQAVEYFANKIQFPYSDMMIIDFCRLVFLLKSHFQCWHWMSFASWFTTIFRKQSQPTK